MKKRNYIVYLGGSITQSTNFIYLRKKFKIILIDQNPNCYCKKYCDIFLNISQTEVKKINLLLKKIINNGNNKIVDCFGIAHYSYPSINSIKKNFISNYKKDNFLMDKDIQKKSLIKHGLTPDFRILPNKDLFKKNSNFYMKKLFQFHNNSIQETYIKTNGTHQGIGIIKLGKVDNFKTFYKKYHKKIIESFKHSRRLYIEKKVNGKLLNLDFIKKKNNKVIFLPLIYRDKVILEGKKQYLSVFQYLNNKNVISKENLKKIEKIIIEKFKNKKIFGTIDAIVNDDNFNVLEMSPHFHNVKIHKFLNNMEVLDIYLNEKRNLKNFYKTNIGGYIFVHEESVHTKKMYKFVKKNSLDTMINYIDIKTREQFLKKHAFIKKNFHLIYFKVKNYKSINKICEYLEKNKTKLYNQ